MTTSSTNDDSLVEEMTPEQFQREKEAMEEAKRKAEEKKAREEQELKNKNVKYEDMDVSTVDQNDYATISKIFKAKGNRHYLNKDYTGAISYYTQALEHCSKDCQFDTSNEEFYDYINEGEESEEESNSEEDEITSDEKRKGRRKSVSFDPKGTVCTENDKSTVNQEDEKGSQERNKTDIIYPDPQEVAVYYCNRAACNLALGKFMEVTSDCTCSLRLKEDYLKAYMRRAQAFEKLDKMEEALKDYEKIVELDVNNYDARKKAMYLSKIVAERQEKLKEETLGKLKDLGNSLLGHVGLSLDNFKMEKNEGGSYNISFQR